MAIYCSSE